MSRYARPWPPIYGQLPPFPNLNNGLKGREYYFLTPGMYKPPGLPLQPPHPRACLCLSRSMEDLSEWEEEDEGWPAGLLSSVQPGVFRRSMDNLLDLEPSWRRGLTPLTGLKTHVASRSPPLSERAGGSTPSSSNSVNSRPWPRRYQPPQLLPNRQNGTSPSSNGQVSCHHTLAVRLNH